MAFLIIVIIYDIGDIPLARTILLFFLLAIFSLTICLVYYLAVDLVCCLGGVSLEGLSGVLAYDGASFFCSHLP